MGIINKLLKTYNLLIYEFEFSAFTSFCRVKLKLEIGYSKLNEKNNQCKFIAKDLNKRC